MHTQIYLNVILLAILITILFIIGKLNQFNKALERKNQQTENTGSELEESTKWHIYLFLALAFIVILFAKFSNTHNRSVWVNLNYAIMRY